MKHKLSLLAALLLALTIPQSVKAYDFSAVSPSGHTLYYYINGSEAIVVYPGSSNSDPYYGYTRPTGSLEIPSSVTYNNTTYSVTAIGSYAFRDCSGLISVIIPNSVTSIGDNAFYFCSGLTSVTIPNSVTSIGSYAFRDCSGLISVIIPNSVTSIGDNAFYFCSGLTSVTIPNSVTSIGNSTFNQCSGLTSVTIPNSVTSIGQYAFYHCSGLTSVTIPNSVTSIGNHAFTGCRGLTSIVVSSGNTYYDSRSNCNAIINTSTNTLIIGCQNTVIPNSVTSIGYNAFDGCSGLTSVTIPNSATSIGQYAFSNCSGLTSVTIPNSVNSIGFGAFEHVRHIEYYGSASGSPWGAFSVNGYTEGDFVYLNSTKTNLRAYLGTGGNVTIPNSVTTIGNYAFYNCLGLTSVTIPNSVTSIGANVFSGCSGLTSVTIPNSVTSIGDHAFSGCSGLTSVTIPSSVTSFGGSAFSGCSDLTTVNFNATNCTYTGSSPFDGCTNLATLNIGENVTRIPTYVFQNCTGLTSVTIPNSVTSIGNCAFYGCSGLTEITSLATTAPTLGSLAFDGVSSTIPVHIPCGSIASYQTTWSYFSNFIFPPVPSFNINVGVADSEFGVANITDGPTCDSTAVFEATANYGYHFTQWNDGNTDNPRTIMLTQDTTLTAYFDRNEYQLTLNSANPTLGTVTGSGIYLYLDTAHIVADAIDHHHLVNWSDGNAEATRDIVITTDLELTATFAIDTYTVNVVSSDIVRGTVEASGTEFVYGTPCTVTATAYTGYTFAGWSNGVNATPYTFAVISDVDLTAIFVEEGEEVYTVTVVSADPTMGTVSGGGQALSSGTVTISATPNEGYRFLRWNDGNTENPRVVTVTGNITYTAYFESTTQGVSTVDVSEISIYSTDGRIVVRGAEGMEMRVFDMVGREVVRPTRSGETPVLPKGVYLVKVGTLPARKVVVIK